MYTVVQGKESNVCMQNVQHWFFFFKVAPITTWNIDVSVEDFLVSWAEVGLICQCFEILFSQLQTSQKSNVEVNSRGPVPRAAQFPVFFKSRQTYLL